MEVIIERFGRSGTILERRHFHQLPVTLGRGYHNDFILEDPYIDPSHARLVLNEDGGLSVQDLHSRNGMQVGKRRHRRGGLATLPWGGDMTLGKTHLRVLTTDHGVAPALPISSWEVGFQAISRPWMVVFGLALLMGLTLLEKWMGFFTEFKLQGQVADMVILALLVLGYGAFWSLIGRILRHDSRFFGHCMVAILALLASSLLTFMVTWLSFNFGLLDLLPYLEMLVLGGLLYLVIRASLYLATHLTHWKLKAAALCVPAMLVGLLGFEHWYQSSQFSKSPHYSEVLLAPPLQWQPAISLSRGDLSTFQKETAELFQPLPKAKSTPKPRSEPEPGSSP